MEFQYNLPVNLIFGRGSVSRIGDIAVDYGSRACIVTGRSSTRKSGLLNRVAEYLEKREWKVLFLTGWSRIR